jgi:NitT/TauT family transport system permease protein
MLPRVNSRTMAAVLPYTVTLACLVLFLASWEYASGRLLDEFWISKPSRIWVRFVDLVESGDLFYHGWITLQEAAIGFLIGGSAGAFMGVTAGRSPFLATTAMPFVIAFYALPKLALAPLLIIWFGIGIDMKIALVAMTVYFPVFMVTLAGARDVSEELLAIVRVMGANRYYIYRHIVLPSVLAWLFVGLKQSVPHAMTAAVVGEIIVSNRGLGYLIARAGGQFDTAGLLAPIVVIAVIGYLFYETLRLLESRLLRWRRAGFEELRTL